MAGNDLCLPSAAMPPCCQQLPAPPHSPALLCTAASPEEIICLRSIAAMPVPGAAAVRALLPHGVQYLGIHPPDFRAQRRDQRVQSHQRRLCSSWTHPLTPPNGQFLVWTAQHASNQLPCSIPARCTAGEKVPSAALQCGSNKMLGLEVPVGNISLRNFTASKSGLSSASPGRPCSAGGGVASCAAAAAAMAAPPLGVPAGWLATSAMVTAAAGQRVLLRLRRRWSPHCRKLRGRDHCCSLLHHYNCHQRINAAMLQL